MSCAKKFSRIFRPSIHDHFVLRFGFIRISVTIMRLIFTSTTCTVPVHTRVYCVRTCTHVLVFVCGLLGIHDSLPAEPQKISMCAFVVIATSFFLETYGCLYARVVYCAFFFSKYLYTDILAFCFKNTHTRGAANSSTYLQNTSIPIYAV